MVILGLIIDSDAIGIIGPSCFIGIIFFFAFFVIALKIFWQTIKNHLGLLFLCMLFLFFPIIFSWFFIFGMLPPILDSYFIVEPAKEYKVEIIKKEFKKGKEGESVSYDKRGRKTVNYKYKIEDQYNLHLKKWYQSSNDKELIVIDVPKEKFDIYKEKQLVYLKSYKGFLGFRHIVIEDNALKPVEDSPTDTIEQSSTNENKTNQELDSTQEK